MTHSTRTQRLGRRVTAWFVGVSLMASLAVGYCAADREAVIHRTDSPFGHIVVTERRSGIRSLYFDEGTARQGAVTPGRPAHLEVAYTRVAVVGMALAPTMERVLYVGLGVGAMPMYTRALWPDARIDVVEIDSAVLDVATRFFGFAEDERMTVHVADGRAFVERAPPAEYDLIVLDAYSDTGIPYHLATREFLEAVRARLAPNGVVASNLWTSSSLYRSMVATFDAVFGEVALVRVARRAQQILVASADGRRFDEAGMVNAARDLAGRVDLGFDLPALVARGYRPPPGGESSVLTDSL